MAQAETQTEVLVNSDALLQSYKSAYDEATQDMEDCDSKIEEQNVLKGNAAIRKGEALYNIKLHMTDEEWKDWIESDECKDSRTVTYNLISIYENFSSSPAGGIGYTKMAELLPLKDNLGDFLSQYDVEHMSREQIRQAKKEYKGEETPAERPKMYTEKQVENKIKIAKMKFHSDLQKTIDNQKKEITKLKNRISELEKQLKAPLKKTNTGNQKEVNEAMDYLRKAGLVK